MVFVTFSSLYSFNNVETPSFDIPHLDKVVHFTFYFVATILGVLFLRERLKSKIGLIKAIVYMVIATILFGVVIEFIQLLCTENRSGDILDGLANSLGSLCGAFVMKRVFSRESRLKWKF